MLARGEGAPDTFVDIYSSWRVMRQKRSLLIVDRDRTKQFRYGLMNVSVVLVLILILTMAMLFKLFESSGGGGECGPESIGAAVNRIDVVWVATSVAVILTGGLCFAYVLFVTHRFLGPLVAISRHIDQLLEGNFDHKSYLRKKDEMQEVAMKLNELSDVLKTEYAKK